MSKLSNGTANGQETAQEGRLGTVISIQANFYHVKLTQAGKTETPLPLAFSDEDIQSAATQSKTPQPSFSTTSPGDTILCTCRMRLKKMGLDIAVGDQVRVVELDEPSARGAIAARLPRHTLLQRPTIANVEQVVLIFALADPTPDPWLLSRFLVQAETTGLNVNVKICLNKLDLGDRSTQQQWQDRLKRWHYPPLLTSAYTGEGIAELVSLLKNKISVFVGPSGVGKSSLINRLVPEVQQPTAKVSGKLKRGRHTTRHVALFELPSGGFIADSPGFNNMELTCAPEQLIHYFPEVREQLRQGDCQYHNCLHDNEPNCVIRKDWERYPHYLKFLAQVIAERTKRKQRPNQESHWKVKSTAAGGRQYEPKLASKTHRRPSRRQQQQQLQEMYQQQTFLSREE